MFIVEDGSIVENADSYVSVADLVAYAALYGYTWTNEQAELYGRKAMDYLNTLNYAGYRVSSEQSLPHPRTDVYVDGVYVPSDSISPLLIKGQKELSISISLGYDPLDVVSAGIKSETFAVFSTTYKDDVGSYKQTPKVDAILAPLLGGYGNGIHGKIATEWDIY